MKVMLLLVLASGFLLSTPPVWAHHSFAAEFDVDKPIMLKGVLTKMDWVNPARLALHRRGPARRYSRQLGD